MLCSAYRSRVLSLRLGAPSPLAAQNSATEKGISMKKPFASAGIAAVVAAGLIMAPGLSPAQASTLEAPATSISAPVNSSGGMGLGGAISGSVATTYGMLFIPCNFLGFRLC